MERNPWRDGLGGDRFNRCVLGCVQTRAEQSSVNEDRAELSNDVQLEAPTSERFGGAGSGLSGDHEAWQI